MKPLVLVTEGLEDAPLQYLREHARTVEASPTSDRFTGALAEADGLIVRTYTQVNDALLRNAPKLRAVGRAGVGLENIDQNACEKRGVRVCSTPDANTRAVCEYVYNLIFALGRPLVPLTGPTTPEAFHRYRKTVRGLELSGKTMGILGMGRIGRAVGKVAIALGMRVIYNDVVDVSSAVEFPAQSVTSGVLLGESDILSLHVSHRPGNRHLIDASALQRMRPHALLINTCRGEVIDSHALAAALRAGQLAGAALDVHDPEPPPDDYPLWGIPNALLLPHLAARTQGAMDAMSWVVKDVLNFLSGAQP